MVDIKINEIYELDGVLLQCLTIRDTNCNTFQIVDRNKNPIILYSSENKGQVIDYGKRIIKNRLSELKLADLKNYKEKQLTLF